MKHLSRKEIEAIMTRCKDGEQVVVHAVPSRAFRVVMIAPDAKQFRVEQLGREGGDRWLPLSLHSGTFAWESYRPALEAMIHAQRDFLLELRKLQVKTNHMKRAAAAGALHVPH